MKDVNSWPTQPLYGCYATKFNFNRDIDGPPKRTCNCYSPSGMVMNEDEQKIWRCAICGSVSLHPILEEPKIKLAHIVIVDTLENGERTWLIGDL